MHLLTFWYQWLLSKVFEEGENVTFCSNTMWLQRRIVFFCNSKYSVSEKGFALSWLAFALDWETVLYKFKEEQMHLPLYTQGLEQMYLYLACFIDFSYMHCSFFTFSLKAAVPSSNPYRLCHFLTYL